jgi:carboxyl-terminal processing protease
MARSSRRSLFLVVFFLLACGFLGILFAQRTGQQSSLSGDTDVKDSLKQFTDVYSIVEENYAEPVNPDKAIYNGAIPGMLHALDPHSNFFDPKSYALMREDQRGKYYGVGMTVGPRNNKVIVIFPFTGTPAYKAGIHPGDVIIAVDGKSTENLSTGDVADMLKGPKGTTVHISISREGVEKPMEFTLVRDEIPRYSVDVHFLIRPGIGYMHVTGFNETTEEEVSKALDEFGDLKGLILDLRGNPGGLLSEGVGVSDKFLKKGQLIVSHHGRASAEKRYVAQHGNGGKDYPLVVLVNRLTASAAEIVSGAIQDHDRGLIVGEVTFGKGLVQTVYPLSENTGLALTTAHYYTPSGRLIQRDYSNISFLDYYYGKRTETKNLQDVKSTDSGRTVYGGGGITPDQKYEPPKYNKFQTDLLTKYEFFNFTAKWFGSHPQAHLTKGWEPDAAVVAEFRQYLMQQNLLFTSADWNDNSAWIQQQLKREMYATAFSYEDSQKVAIETDPMVLKAIDAMPDARALLDKSKKLIVERIQRDPLP